MDGNDPKPDPYLGVGLGLGIDLICSIHANILHALKKNERKHIHRNTLTRSRQPGRTSASGFVQEA